MLDLQQISAQVQAAGYGAAKRRHDLSQHTNRAASAAFWEGKDTTLEHRRLQLAQTSWLAAAPVSGLPSDTFPAPSVLTDYSVVAADGSQIAPDRHSRAGGVYLLNVGRIRLSYRAAPSPMLRPRLDSVAEVLTLEGDDEEAERQASASVGPRRFAREMNALAMLAEEAGSIGLPTVALTDGSLIAWHLRELDAPSATMPTDGAQAEAFAALLDLLAQARDKRVPVAGYVSGSGSRDVINTLRIALCPLEKVNCLGCPFAEGMRPCEPVRLATDTGLFGRLLRVGERSTVFTAQGQATGFSQILRHYPPDQWITFFYLNVGAEVARIEIPRWVADDATLLDRVHAVCLDQAAKGRGYPVALAEAHEQAVVTGADRVLFHRLLERAMVRDDLPVSPSPKAVAKRTRFL